jgi:DNA-binding GntR family transcriptional regulator
MEFDDAICRSCRNSRMARVLGDLRNALALIGNTSMRAPGRGARSLAEHEAILQAVDAGDVEGAVAATQAHVRSIARDSVAPAAVAQLTA